ncbi:hypothetical protein Sste5346_002016 [Sporothrix stenoceras]|uniref:Uncharacterized protein n=1 Tax=Sporothrix stenoceras TaxID=5173 RepID=A0ABR3ZJQ9_9PEZI
MSETQTTETKVHGSFAVAASDSSKDEQLMVKLAYYLPPTVARAPSIYDLELINGSRDQDIVEVAMHDVRGKENQFKIDTHGFQYIKVDSKMHKDDFDYDERIEESYFPEVEGWLKQLYPMAAKIHHLGHIVRGAVLQTDFSKPAPAWNKPNRGIAPAPRVHIDFTREGGFLVLAQAFGQEESDAVRARGKRVLCFSVWRPLSVVKRDPLGVVDCNSVHEADLYKLQRIFPDGAKGENVVVKANGQTLPESRPCHHKWHYMSEQTPQDVLVIKTSDTGDCDWETIPGGRVGCSPHASFALPGTEREHIRESVEVRCIIEL